MEKRHEIPYLECYEPAVIRDHQCGFRSNKSTTDRVFCIRQIVEKKWEYSEAVHQIFVDFNKAYYSVGGRSCIRFSLSLVSP
jgi:hypothetical protein